MRGLKIAVVSFSYDVLSNVLHSYRVALCNETLRADEGPCERRGAPLRLRGWHGMAKANPRKANGNARRKLRSWLKAQGRPCWICQAFGLDGTIDYSLPARHPLSFEVDELVPVSKGGSPFDRNNVDAAHRRCNQWRGNKSVSEVMRIARSGGSTPQPATLSVRGTTSREW